MKNITHLFLLKLIAFSLLSSTSNANDSTKVNNQGKINATNKISIHETNKVTVIPDADNAGLKLPSGFGALKVADSVGRARHIAITDKGDIYIKLFRLVNGKGIVLLKDNNGDGRADTKTAFGNYLGTGMAIKGKYLFASSDEEVFRYALNDNGEVLNQDAPEKIVTGLINRRQHESKSIALDAKGNIYVNVGAYSNSCQEQDRQKGSQGRKPCNILDSAGGIWKFSTSKIEQKYGDGVRYATGLRNVVGLDWNTQNDQLFVMQHGRDQLHDLFPDLYDEKANAEKPAETMYAIKEGTNAGWPYIYYDPALKKKIVAPEYGGDGKMVSEDTRFDDPAMSFPAHMAPNGLLFYTGNQFPAKYKNGAFVAFHGSWNRAPLPQEGYYVAFAPFENGKPTGKWEVFANGFAGIDVVMGTKGAQHRPCGLAQGPDGSLYVTDDSKGTIYRIIYTGK